MLDAAFGTGITAGAPGLVHPIQQPLSGKFNGSNWNYEIAAKLDSQVAGSFRGLFTSSGHTRTGSLGGHDHVNPDLGELSAADGVYLGTCGKLLRWHWRA